MKEKIKKNLYLLFKWVLSVEYILGFIPTLFIHYFLNLFKKPESDREFNKRMLYVQAFVFPVIIGTLIVFLAFYFQSFALEIFAIIISGLYVLNIIYAQYKDDVYIKIVAEGDEKRRNILKRRLIITKVTMFWITMLIVGILIPYE